MIFKITNYNIKNIMVLNDQNFFQFQESRKKTQKVIQEKKKEKNISENTMPI